MQRVERCEAMLENITLGNVNSSEDHSSKNPVHQVSFPNFQDYHYFDSKWKTGRTEAVFQGCLLTLLFRKISLISYHRLC